MKSIPQIQTRSVYLLIRSHRWWRSRLTAPWSSLSDSRVFPATQRHVRTELRRVKAAQTTKSDQICGHSRGYESVRSIHQASTQQQHPCRDETRHSQTTEMLNVWVPLQFKLVPTATVCLNMSSSLEPWSKRVIKRSIGHLLNNHLISRSIWKYLSHTLLSELCFAGKSFSAFSFSLAEVHKTKRFAFGFWLF